MHGNIDIVIAMLFMYAIAWACMKHNERKAQKK